MRLCCFFAQKSAIASNTAVYLFIQVNISKDAQVSGIFIKNIIAGSPAEKCKLIKIGDRILSVNDNDVRQATQDETINLIKNAGCSISLILQSFDGNGVSIYNMLRYVHVAW